MSSSEDVSLREYFERILEERHAQYDVRFKASETAVSAALAAQEKATASAFAANEKAIVKAEDAQREYNVRSNEFRGQLDDQAKTLMPRNEADARFKSMTEKIDLSQTTVNERIELLRSEIAGLRESRSAATGASIGTKEFWGYIIGAAGLVSIILTIVFRFVPT